MKNIIPGIVYGHKDIEGATRLAKQLKVFPTPFKVIYYVPYESERSGWYVTDPRSVIFSAARIDLGSDEYYFGLNSSLYYNRIIWNAVGVDIINRRISRTIKRKMPSEKYWRGKVIRKIMSGYPFPVRFHRIMDFDLKGVIRKGNLAYSDIKRTKSDAAYLCRKGDKTACEVLKILEKQGKESRGR